MKWTLLLMIAMNIIFGGIQIWQSSNPVVNESTGVETRFNNLALSNSQQRRLETANKSVAVEQPKAATKCVRIRGLDKDDGINIIQSRLKALEVTTTQKKVQVVVRTDYQVILGPFLNENQARAELQALSARGIESYVISSGKHKNALSLGVFSSENNASRKLTELLEQEVVGSLVTKEHLGEAIELLMDRKNSSLISDATLESLLKTYPRADFSRFPCN